MNDYKNLVSTAGGELWGVNPVDFFENNACYLLQVTMWTHFANDDLTRSGHVMIHPRHRFKAA